MIFLCENEWEEEDDIFTNVNEISKKNLNLRKREMSLYCLHSWKCLGIFTILWCLATVSWGDRDFSHCLYRFDRQFGLICQSFIEIFFKSMFVVLDFSGSNLSMKNNYALKEGRDRGRRSARKISEIKI